MTLHRWKLTIEYDGSGFSGWQRQEPGVPSVQAAVEEAIKNFCGADITIHVAGRTDAGVHAWGQVAHADLDLADRYTGFHVVKALNAHLRTVRVAVIDAAIAADDFHARFSATNKLYTYRIINRPAPLAVEQGRAWVVHPDLDIEAMRRGAVHLVGTYDFTSFRDSDCQAKSPIKTLDRLDIETQPYDAYGGVEIRVHAEARSFLHHQVRNMVGTLVQVGLGRFAPGNVADILAARARSAAGMTAPPDGLYLMRIDYPRVAGG
jgi:tRNA pseudouridine38-40 synthase